MNKNKKHRTHLILKISVFLFAIYSIINILSLSSSIVEKQSELDNIKQQIYEQQVANQKLSESISGELTDEEIAEIAMNKLDYAYPGERVYNNITGK